MVLSQVLHFENKLSNERHSICILHLVIKFVVTIVYLNQWLKTIILESNVEGTFVIFWLNWIMTRLQNNGQHLFKRPVCWALFILNAELKKGNACLRIGALLSIFNGPINLTVFFFFIIKVFPVKLDLKQKDILWKVLDKMNEHIETNIIQAIFGKGEPIFLLDFLITNFTAP